MQKIICIHERFLFQPGSPAGETNTNKGQEDKECSVDKGLREFNCNKNEKIRVHNLRPNLNPYSNYQNWVEANRLKKGAKARFLRFCLDSVALVPLVNRSLLFRALSNSYNRCIEPFQKPFDKKFQHTEDFQRKVDGFKPKKYETKL